MAPISISARADTIVDNGQTVDYNSGLTSFSDALVLGQVGSGTVNINGGATVQMNTMNGSTASRIEIGNGTGSNGALNINGGTLAVNIANGPTAGTSIGRIWVGGGRDNTTGGTGTLNLSSGLIDFVPVVAGTGNYGGLAIGRGVGVVGTVNQTGGTIRFDSGGAVDLGILGGTGSYDLRNGAVFDASHGGVTVYVGSRTGSGNQLSTGNLSIYDNAKFTLTTGENSGGQIFVGDAGSTGTILQTGTGSVVTFGLLNPIRFGGNISNDAHGGGSGTYRLEAGSFNVLNNGGSAQTIFGDTSGGTGTFAISGGTANVATALILGNSVGSTGLIDQTGGTLSLTGSARLQFGSGTGTYNLTGGTLALGGVNAISGSGALNFGDATLRVQGSSLTTSNAATLLAGTHFTFDTNGVGATWSGALSGAGGLIKAGGGVLTLAAANSYTGTTTIAGGTLALTNPNGLNSSSAVATSSGTNLDLTGLATGAIVNIGALSGVGTVKLGDSYLISTIGAGQSAAFSGTITSNAWGYEANYGRFLKAGAGDLVINGSTMEKGEGYIVAGSMTQSAGTTTWSNLNVGSGTGATGTLNVSGGSLTLNLGMRVGDFGGIGTVQQTGGVIRLQQSCGDLNRCPALNIGNQGGTGTYNISGGQLLLEGGSHSIGRNSGSSPASSGTLNISGTGLVQLSPSNSNGVFVIGDRDPGSAPNSTGIINQTGGTLRIIGGSEFYLGGYGSGTYNLDGGALEIGGTSLRGNFPGGVTPYAFNLGGGTVRVIGTALTTSVRATLLSGTSSTIDTNGLGATWSGVLSGGGGLIKAGTGTLTLTGSNTYGGATTISGGTLALAGAGNIGSVAALTNNGTFDISGVTTNIPGTTTRGVALASLSGNGTVINGVNALVSGLDNSNTSFSGKIVNSGNSWDAAYGTFTKAGSGTLTIDGATIQSGEARVTRGALAQSSGTTSIDYLAVGTGTTGGTANAGALNVSGGNISFGVALQVGDWGGHGTVTQTGGTVTIAPTCGDSAHCAAVNIGNQGGTGTYTITGGTLASIGGTMTIGRNSTGHAASTGELNVGGNAIVSLTGGASLVVGNRAAMQPSDIAGSGTINQSGGTLTVDAGSRLYLSGSGNGVYNLHSGTLQIGGTSLVPNYNNLGGSYNFNLGGGTIKVIGSTLVSAVDATLINGTTSTIDTNGFGAVWSGNLSGDGALNKIGGGVLTLSGSNSYSGGTTVSAGALQGNTASLQGAITNNASVVFDQGTAGTYAGNMSGSGSLTKSGAGVLTLSGSNSYAGGTTVSAGALQGNAVSLQGTITNNASVVFDQGTAGTYAGNMSGSGSLTKSGAGVLTLSGSNSYSGGTTVSAGALQGNTASLQGAITNNASVVFDQGTAGTYAGNMSGSGSLTKIGAGVLTLSGSNSYSGGTIVSDGILRLGSATALPTMGALTVDGGEIDLNGNNLTVNSLAGLGGTISLGSGNLTASSAGNTTLSSAITGTGGLNKTGGGTLILSGANTYTGPTSIDDGRLAVNGSITSDVTVGSGGNLGGSGTITGTVSSGGTLAPGNSIGTLTVNGSFTQAAGSTYQVEVNTAGQADRTNVIGAPGTAIISGGTVQTLAAPGVYAPSTTYTIVNATGGVTGTYAGVTSNYVFLQASLGYDANNVYLTLKPGGFAAGAATGNQAAVGTALDRSVAAATGDFATVVGTLATATLAQGQAAMNAVSGQNYAGFSNANVGSGLLFLSAIGQQLAAARGGDPGKGTRVALAEACEIEACDASPWSLWATGLAGFGSVAGDANAGTVTYNAGGAATGIDYRFSPNLLAGFGIGFASGNQWTNGFSGRGTTDSYQASVYASFTQGGFWIDALGGYAHNDNRMTRQIAIAGLQPRTANGAAGADQLMGQVEAGYRLGLYAPAAATIAPFARLQGTTVMQNGFTETGAGFLNLSVAPQTTDSLRSILGAELTAQVPTGVDRRIGLLLRLGWVHEYANTARPVTAAFAGVPGSNFTVFGAAPTRDAAALAFAADTAIGERSSIYLRYDGEVGTGTDSHAFSAGLRMTW
ncbi:MAG: autotransporter-associated beta strand repeat-containing protein [Reyranella sp.]|nr:autotransporter-associated beta strand repeat-containing protein [Reyranella sp.]